MTRLITSSLSSKAQLTLPKEIRAILGILGKGDLVGFLVDNKTRSVRLAKIEPMVSDTELTAQDCRRLMKLRGKKGSKRFRSMASLRRELKA